ncbi:MAG: mechanosensitive ion channel [Tyzzerella sp.]|nr:mechanosensitive ion channel [Tyzzerella sp.]
MLLAKTVEGEEVVEEVSKLTQYINDKIPDIIDFAFSVILALVVFVIGAKLIGWVRKLVKRSLQHSSVDKGVEQFVDSMLKFGLYALLIFSIGKNFGLDTTSVAAVLASGGVAIGLALQGSLSNFAGGVLILLLKPFVVGDYIIEDTNKCEGTVKEIQIFYTKLVTADNKTVVIPNGTLANNSLTNVTAQDKRKLDLKVDISYDADLKKAKELIETLLKNDASIKQEEEILVFVDSLASSSVVLGARAWVKTEEYWTTRWRLLENIKLTLDENGIEIPYQQLTVHMENQGAEKGQQ